MKRLASMILLALLLAGCASTWGSAPPEKWTDQNAAWECQKLNSMGWAASRSPCSP